ncbi:hypothetical protein ABWK49_26600 [Priestia megaterium]
MFGYYIEVTRANLHLLPEGMYERKQTFGIIDISYLITLKSINSIIGYLFRIVFSNFKFRYS